MFTQIVPHMDTIWTPRSLLSEVIFFRGCP